MTASRLCYKVGLVSSNARDVLIPYLSDPEVRIETRKARINEFISDLDTLLGETQSMCRSLPSERNGFMDAINKGWRELHASVQELKDILRLQYGSFNDEIFEHRNEEIRGIVNTLANKLEKLQNIGG